MMKTWVCTCVLLVLSIWTARALEVKLDESDEGRQRCAGMYSRKAWGGPVDPFILVKFTDVGKGIGNDPVASIVIFEWQDEGFIGVYPSPDAPLKVGICEQKLVDSGFCNSTNLGEFILAPNATALSVNAIKTEAVHLKQSHSIHYSIKKTGYYCVLTDRYTATKYEAVVEFRNAFGELPAAQIPKLPFYGGITIFYALLLLFWSFLYVQHRSDILPVQNYITAILVFLVVEMLLTWGYYDFLNRSGSTTGSTVFLVVVAVLNAIRNSFSFFLLLIVCMGYGVVKSSLGRTMIYVRWLAIAHFIFGLVYAITSLVITPDHAGLFLLLIVLPLASTLTMFYVWTLNSLNYTLRDLRERKQFIKEAMYKKLWWCILISILVLFGFFFFNSFSFASARDPDYVPFHWKSRWFVLDGWLNLVYFADVAYVAYIWRPTANNKRFAMSDEIAQEDDGTFEIANLDIGVPEDLDSDDEEAQIGTKPRSASASHNGNGGNEPQSSQGRSQPQNQRSTHPRQSLDGETIFAVGEDGDKFSDDEESDEDRDLMRKNQR